MGREGAHAEIFASLSRHNDENDAQHDALWADLTARVRAIVNEPQYETINADMVG